MNAGIAVLAGAQLSTVDEDFARSLGLEQGILAVRVPSGTAAADAGLRSGDMITAVNGVSVKDMAPLRRAFVEGGARDVRLTVATRGAPPRVITVRW